MAMDEGRGWSSGPGRKRAQGGLGRRHPGEPPEGTDHRTSRSFRVASHLALALTAAGLVAGLLRIQPAGDPRPQQDPPPPTALPSPTPPPGLPIALQAGGDVTALALAGDRLLLGHGPRVLLVDPATSPPQVLAQTGLLPGLVTDLAVDGERAYAVTAGYAPEADNRLVVLRLRGDQAPEVLGMVAEPWLSDVFAADGQVYVTAARSIILFDLKDPAAPVKQGAAYLLPADILVQGKLVYLPSFDGLHILDVTDPLAPRQLGHWVTEANTYDVVVHQGRAFVTGSEQLHVLDVADPAQPTLLTQLPIPGGAVDLDLDAASGTLLAAFGAGEGLRRFDVRDPAAPVELSALGLPGEPQALRFAGGRAYVSSAEAGLQVLSLADSGGLELTGTLPLAPAPVDLRWLGDRALVWSYGQMRLLPTTGARAGSLGPGWAPDRNLAPQISAGEIAGGRVLAAHADRLTSFALPEAEAPFQPAEARLEAPVTALLWSGGRAYLAEEGSLSIASLDNPARPKILGELRGDWSARDLARSGNLLYIAGGEPGLAVIDVADPARPLQVGSLSVAGVSRVEVVGDRIFLATQAGLELWERASGGDLRALGRIATARPLVDVVVAGRLAYLLSEDALLQVLDIADFAAPRLLAAEDLPGVGAALRVLGDQALVAARAGGFYRLTLPRGLASAYLPSLAR